MADLKDPPSTLGIAVLAGLGAALAGWAIPALDLVNALRALHGRPKVATLAEHDAEVTAEFAARKARS